MPTIWRNAWKLTIKALGRRKVWAHTHTYAHIYFDTVNTHTHSHTIYCSLSVYILPFSAFPVLVWQWHLTFTLNAHVYLCVWGGVWWLELLSFHSYVQIYAYIYCSNEYPQQCNSGAFRSYCIKLTSSRGKSIHTSMPFETMARHISMCMTICSNKYICTAIDIYESANSHFPYMDGPYCRLSFSTHFLVSL